MVGVDYFTNWVEAVALKDVTQQDVVDFVENHIVCQFGFLKLSQLIKELSLPKGVVEYANSRSIKLLTSTPYYAQANKQVEVINKILIALIEKHICRQPRNWHNTLDQILWAYRCSPKEATDTSPYRLVYGHDVVLPVEINLQSIRMQRQNDLLVKDYYQSMFDEFHELHDERLIALENLIQQKERIARFYDSRVKYKSSSV